MKSRLLSVCFVFVTVAFLRADLVDMQNGDRYVGQVLSMTSDTLMLRSEMLGTLKLPRNRIANITLGASASTNTSAVKSSATTTTPNRPITEATPTNPPTDLSSAIRQLGANSNLLQQVQSEYLSTAGPEANQKFTEMMTGLITGKLTANDLRNEAQSAADQLRELKKDLGDDVGDSVDIYLSILDNFLKEAAPAPVPANVPKTDFSATAPASKAKAPAKNE